MLKQLISPIFSTCLAVGAGILIYFIKIRLTKLLQKDGKSHAAIKFAINFGYGVVLFILLIPVLTEFGVPTASLLTILGTSSLAIGLSLKGFLSNIASGMMVLLQRPFVIGDTIESQGVMGTVEKIELFSVCIRTPSNELVYIQNNKLIADKIVNKNSHQRRRQDLTIEVGYESDLSKVKQIIADCVTNESRILQDPPPVIVTERFNDSSIAILVRFWGMTKDLLQTKQSLLEQTKIQFELQGIDLPFPQIEVTLKKSSGLDV